VTIAVELIPNELEAGIVRALRRGRAGRARRPSAGPGHAHLDGDVVDAIETVAELHRARSRARQSWTKRRPPVAVRWTIDWAGALTSLQKVGYDGTVVEPRRTALPKETLAKAKVVRGRMERHLTTL
jgi:hypothetical protein